MEELSRKTQVVHVFDNTVEALQCIKAHEDQHTVKYVYVYTKKDFGVTDIFGKKHWVRWSTEDLLFTGIPFLSLSTKSMECCQGKNRRKHPEGNNTIGDHSSMRKQTIVQHTKKFDCPAQVKLLEIAFFPSFKVVRDTIHNRKKNAKMLRDALYVKDSSLRFERKIVTILPDIREHKGHFIGEAAGISQSIDKSLVEKIKDLMQHGVTDVKEMQKHLHIHVMEVFAGSIPRVSNQRYFPREKVIRNHMDVVRRKQKQPIVVQRCLVDTFQQSETEKFITSGEESNMVDSSTDGVGSGSDLGEDCMDEDDQISDPIVQVHDDGDLCRTLLKDISDVSYLIDEPSVLNELYTSLKRLKYKLEKQISKEKELSATPEGWNIPNKRKNKLQSIAVKRKCVN